MASVRFSTAIDKYVYVLIKERFDDKIYLNYAARKEIVDDICEVQHELVREAGLITGLRKGFGACNVCRHPFGRLRPWFVEQPYWSVC